MVTMIELSKKNRDWSEHESTVLLAEAKNSPLRGSEFVKHLISLTGVLRNPAGVANKLVLLKKKGECSSNLHESVVEAAAKLASKRDIEEDKKQAKTLRAALRRGEKLPPLDEYVTVSLANDLSRSYRGFHKFRTGRRAFFCEDDGLIYTLSRPLLDFLASAEKPAPKPASAKPASAQTELSFSQPAPFNKSPRVGTRGPLLRAQILISVADKPNEPAVGRKGAVKATCSTIKWYLRKLVDEKLLEELPGRRVDAPLYRLSNVEAAVRAVAEARTVIDSEKSKAEPRSEKIKKTKRATTLVTDEEDNISVLYCEPNATYIVDGERCIFSHVASGFSYFRNSTGNEVKFDARTVPTVRRAPPATTATNIERRVRHEAASAHEFDEKSPEAAVAAIAKILHDATEQQFSDEPLLRRARHLIEGHDYGERAAAEVVADLCKFKLPSKSA